MISLVELFLIKANVGQLVFAGVLTSGPPKIDYPICVSGEDGHQYYATSPVVELWQIKGGWRVTTKSGHCYDILKTNVVSMGLAINKRKMR